MYLDVRAAAQACKKQLHRAEVMLPLANATAEECHAAHEAATHILSRNRSLSSKKNVPGRYVASGRPTTMLESHREDLHHALSHLRESAEKGEAAMVERADALDACVAALHETLDQLCALTPDATMSRRPDGMYGGHGLLSPGTLAPSNLASALSLSHGNGHGTSDAASVVSSHHALSIIEGTDSRAEVEQLVSVAGQFSRAAHNLSMHTRGQVIAVRRDLQSHREKAANAQRRMATTAVSKPDHLSAPGAPRSRSPSTRSPPRSARAPRGAASPPEPSPLDVGQDSIGGPSVFRWPRVTSSNRRHTKRPEHAPFTDPRLTGKPRPAVTI